MPGSRKQHQARGVDASGGASTSVRRGRAGRIGLSRKLIACIVIGLVLVVPAIFVNTVIGYLPIIAYLFVLLLCYVYIRILRNQLDFETLVVNAACYREESVDFDLIVYNYSFLPAIRIAVLFYMSDIFGGEGATDIRYITLAPHRAKRFGFSVTFDHIGNYHVGIKEVTVLDPLEIFASTEATDELAEVNVQPRLFDVSELDISTDATIEARRNFSATINDGMDYAGTREYVWGDPIKTIHWKLSARAPEGEYYTRLYETNANPGMAIIADFDAPAYNINELMSIYDAVVESSLSLCRYAVTNDFDAELIFDDKDKQRQHYYTPLAGKKQEVLDRMPQIFSPGSGRDALGILEDESRSIYAQQNLIVCTSVVSDELISTLSSARTGKRQPILFAIIPSTASDERREEIEKRLKRAQSSGVSWTIISGAKDLPGAMKLSAEEEEEV